MMKRRHRYTAKPNLQSSIKRFCPAGGMNGTPGSSLAYFAKISGVSIANFLERMLTGGIVISQD